MLPLALRKPKKLFFLVLSPARNKYEDDDCLLEPVEDFSVFNGFCCGDKDLNGFLHEDAAKGQEELLSITYAFRLKEGEEVSLPVAFVSILNDSIELTMSRKRSLLPWSKRGYESYPAVKVGRLGVDSRYQRKMIGTMLLTVLKSIFVTQNRTGCRFMTVDAYREAVPFYIKNDFDFLTVEEREGNSDTASMYFDLKRFLESIQSDEK